MQLSFYKVDENYCDYLRKTDPCVPYVKDGKERRPFIGVVLHINAMKYYAPLSSPKHKHINMKNQIDFLRINGGKWGAINFNNMIPVHDAYINKIDISNMPINTQEETNYKNLLQNQLSWCNSHRNDILQRAEHLYYHMTTGKPAESLAKRCCNFLLNETMLVKYCQLNGICLPEAMKR
jgi:protein AbiQ